MGYEEHVRVKDKNMVSKFMNKLPSKFQIAKYLAIFVGILVFGYVFYVIKLNYNNVAALTTAILLVLCYLLCDLIYTSDFKLTKRSNKELIPENKTEQEQNEEEWMKESLKMKNKELSDENEELKKQLQRMENDKDDNLNRMKDDLVSVIKSRSVRTKQGLRKELEELRHWVVENVCGEPNELSRLENRYNTLVFERDSMVKKMACLEERCEQLAEKAEEGNSLRDLILNLTEKITSRSSGSEDEDEDEDEDADEDVDGDDNKYDDEDDPYYDYVNDRYYGDN